MMPTFLFNKYTTYYFRIITRAMNRKFEGYGERHHIIPLSLGGTNEKSNLVKLTAKEHFVCHRFLTKMTTGLHKKSMTCALMRMAGAFRTKNPKLVEKPRISSSTFEHIRKEFAESRKGFKHTAATRQKMSDSKKLLTISPEHRKAMTEGKRGMKFTDAHKAAMSASQKGRMFTEEHRMKLSASLKGKGRKPLPISIDGKDYESIAIAAKTLNILSSTLYYRAKSASFPKVYFK